MCPQTGRAQLVTFLAGEAYAIVFGCDITCVCPRHMRANVKTGRAADFRTFGVGSCIVLLYGIIGLGIAYQSKGKSINKVIQRCLKC